MPNTLRSLDLNLLRVFDSVMEERSVLRASLRIGLSQSAVSHSLARLRDVLGDDLFVRTASGMEPTARALAMSPLISEALAKMELAVGSARFDPATSSLRFVIAANDYLTAVVIPHFLKALQSAAPLVNIVIRPSTRIDLTEQIDLGRIDVAIGSFANLPGRLKSSTLFEYEDVLVTHAGHRFAGKEITLGRLADVPLLVVSLGGEEEGAVNGFISERGLARKSEMFDRKALEAAFAASATTPRLVVLLPHFLALPSLLAGADYAAIVPRPLASVFAATGSVRVHPLPYAAERTVVQAVWHERTDSHPAYKWLRAMLGQAADTAAVRPHS